MKKGHFLMQGGVDIQHVGRMIKLVNCSELDMSIQKIECLPCWAQMSMSQQGQTEGGYQKRPWELFELTGMASYPSQPLQLQPIPSGTC